MIIYKRMAVVAGALSLAGVMTVAPMSSASAATYTCHYDQGANNYVYASYYFGTTIQPSSSGLSQAGIEAQCVLKYRGYNPGTVDGVFGTNSQSAARKFQKRINALYHVGLDEDGKVGPQTWPYLRNLNYDY